MKKLKKFKLNGEIPALTKSEESKLKGGFGSIDGPEIGLYGNRNCGSGNGRRCDNINCVPCVCNEYM